VPGAEAGWTSAAARDTIAPAMDANQGSRQRATKRLFVLRHAKSSWDDPGLDDHERPLAPRGLRATEALRQYVRDNGLDPEIVLCSSARRARETLEGVAPKGEWMIEDELYAADAAAVLDRLRRVPEDTGAVMVIGHNPGLQVLVLRLADTLDPPSDEAGLEAVRRKFPTGALATLTFECDWTELSFGSARLSSFVRPKQLLHT
jgi:phosphohistidine phosphatase